MNILKNLLVEETRQRRPLAAPLTVSFACSPTDSGRMLGQGLAAQDEFSMRLGLEVKFWANKAQYNSARVIAERVLLHKLYGSALARIDAATHAVFNDDTEEALLHLSALRKELLGED